MERGAKVSGARFYFLTGVGAGSSWRLLQHGDGPGPRPRLRPDDHADAGQARRHGRHRLPRPGRRRRLPDRGRRPVPRRHLRGRRCRRTTPTRSSTSRRCRSATPAQSPATARRPARTARTPAASSGCTSSTRSRCSSTCRPEDADAEHERLLAAARRTCSTALELAYRVIDIAAGDLGCPRRAQVRLRGAGSPRQGTYRELTSTSNCTDLPGPPPRHPGRGEQGNAAAGRDAQRHACATTRWIVAILETHQQADGSVASPRRCAPTSGRDVLTPVR